MITQIGWQFESRFFTTEGGLTGLTEIVPLVGGIDQNKFKPSVSFLFGARTDRGNEFAVGPLVSIPVSSDDNINTSFIFAFGMTKRQGNIFFPINSDTWFNIINEKRYESTRVIFIFINRIF